MVLSSNGGLCEGSSNKRIVENGYHSSCMRVVPKYKVRKVSAIRDFPPGCGPNAPKIDSKPEEDEVRLDVTIHGDINANGARSSATEADSQFTQVVNIPAPMITDVSLSDLNGKVVAGPTNGRVTEEVNLQLDPSPLQTQLPEDFDNNEGKIVNYVSESRAQAPEKVLDEVSPLSVMKSEDKGDKVFVLEIGGAHDLMEPLAGGKSLSPSQFPINNGSRMEENSPMPKNKYRRRKVSAIRDFPPFCGRNAYPPPEGERPRVICGEKSLVVVEKSNEKNEQTGMLNETLAAAESKEMVKPNLDNGVLGEKFGASADLVESSSHGADQETKVIAKDGEFERNELERNVDTPEMMIDEDGENTTKLVGKELPIYSGEKSNENLVEEDNTKSGDEEEHVIAHGLMAKSNMQKRGKKASGSKELPVYSDDNGNENLVEDNYTNSGDEEEHVIVHGLMAKSNVQKRGNKASGSKELPVYSNDKGNENLVEDNNTSSGDEEEHVIVHGLMAESYIQKKGVKASSGSAGRTSGDGTKKQGPTWRQKSKAVARKSSGKIEKSGRSSVMTKSLTFRKSAPDPSPGAIVIRDSVDSAVHDEDTPKASPDGCASRDFDVILPPFGPNSSSQGDARDRVRETLRLFNAICRKLLQGEEAKSQLDETKSRQSEKAFRRIDLSAAKIIKEKGKEVNTEKQILGAVPGVEVGDEFQYRVELALVGIHRLYQAGIDSVKHEGQYVATSIVASGGYSDDLDNADILIYSGQGGVGKDKKPEDQKLERGNLALYNSKSARNPVRVIRGSKENKNSDASDSRPRVVTTYVYDGLYTVDNYWTETGPQGNLVFMFQLSRIPGQPELAWKEVKSSKKLKVRHGVCVDDIAERKELVSISAVNIINNEKPQPFTYINKMMYPDWFKPDSPRGCDCTGRCSDSRKCLCVMRNGGEIPYNRNGAIVEAKSLVYECGPSCKCPPSCYNRVSQHGIKIQLEVFKTESRGWGLRSLTSIPSGSFVCEYAGELLQDKEAEERTGNDEYLFDIGQNYNDCAFVPSCQVEKSELVEDGGFTIDAAKYGNVGRFINHSCSPNLYAQNVLFDHDDKKIPHIMLFAAENIPPLKELTYHYNYSVDQVRDSNGNIKMKSCFCGSSDCSGRMY